MSYLGKEVNELLRAVRSMLTSAEHMAVEPGVHREGNHIVLREMETFRPVLFTLTMSVLETEEQVADESLLHIHPDFMGNE